MDATSKTILDYLISQNRGCRFSISFLDNEFEDTCALIGLDSEDARAAVRFLHDTGYLDYMSTTSGHNISFSLSHKGLNYKDFPQQQVDKNSHSHVFNIGTVTNSAFGNSGDVTLNIGASFDDLKNFINSQDIPQNDKNALLEITTQVETMIDNEIPFKKGFLSKFKDVLKTYDGYIVAISQLAFDYFIGIR